MFCVVRFPAPTVAQPTQTVVNGVPLSVLLELYAQRANRRLIILPGTPNPSQRFVGEPGITPYDAITDLVRRNGLGMLVRRSVLTVGRMADLAARYPGSSSVITKAENLGTMTSATLLANIESFAPPSLLVFASADPSTVIVRGTPADIASFETSLGSQLPNVQRVEIPILQAAGAADIVKTLTTMDPPSGNNALVANIGSNAVDVRGTSDYVARVKADLSMLDHSPLQVNYVVTLYEVDPKTFNSTLGVSLGQAQTSATAVGNTAITSIAPPLQGTLISGFPLRLGLNIASAFHFLEQHGAAAVLNRQSLTMTIGSNAENNHITYTPYLVTDQYTGISTVQSAQTGITLSITPTGGPSALQSAITLNYSAIAGYGPQNVPIITKDGGTTNVVALPDQPILVDGLFAEASNTTTTGIPGLDRLPLLGPLFRTDSKTGERVEIVVLIQPHLVTNPHQTYPAIFPDIHAPVTHKSVPAPVPYPPGA